MCVFVAAAPQLDFDAGACPYRFTWCGVGVLAEPKFDALTEIHTALRLRDVTLGVHFIPSCFVSPL